MGPQIDPAYFIAEHLNSLYRFLQNYLDFNHASDVWLELTIS
jgi:hypothetical protein